MRKSLDTGDVIDWLLEEENPSVRYFTLTDILDRRTTDRDVILAKQGIMTSGVVPKILAKQMGQAHLSHGRCQGPQGSGGDSANASDQAGQTYD
jgi:hypothetical protein